MSQVGFHCATCDLFFPVYEVYLEHTTSRDHLSKAGGRKKALPVTVEQVWERIRQVETEMQKKNLMKGMTGEELLKARFEQRRQERKQLKQQPQKEEIVNAEHDEEVYQAMGFKSFGK